jgi:hypothetical protein
MMKSVYLLFDPSSLSDDDADSPEKFNSCIKCVFENRTHAINEQVKLRDSLNRPIYILKQNVIDPASIVCKKNMLDKMLPTHI